MMRKMMALFLLVLCFSEGVARERGAASPVFGRKRFHKSARFPKGKRFRFGRFECSEFPLTESEYAFVVGVSGLSREDFVVSAEHHDMRRFKHRKIIDVEKCEATKIDNLMCEQITHINQLFFCGWGKLAGYESPYELYDELLIDKCSKFNQCDRILQVLLCAKWNLRHILCSNRPKSRIWHFVCLNKDMTDNFCFEEYTDEAVG